MYLDRPDCKVTTKDKVNDVLGDGATINSTFSLLYGKVTIEMSAPSVAGVVSAAILIGVYTLFEADFELKLLTAEQSDEIDIELVGGDPKAWQTNVFAPAPQDQEPLWGVFGTVEDLLHPSTIDQFHKYTIDWNADRIIWSVDGTAVRTLKKGKSKSLHGFEL